MPSSRLRPTPPSPCQIWMIYHLFGRLCNGMGAIGLTERRAVERVFDGGTRDEVGVLDNIGTVGPKAEHFLSTSLIISRRLYDARAIILLLLNQNLRPHEASRLWQTYIELSFRDFLLVPPSSSSYIWDTASCSIPPRLRASCTLLSAKFGKSPSQMIRFDRIPVALEERCLEDR